MSEPTYWPGGREQTGPIGDGTPHARMEWFWDRMEQHKALIEELTDWSPVSSTYRFEAAIADAFDALVSERERLEAELHEARATMKRRFESHKRQTDALREERDRWDMEATMANEANGELTQHIMKLEERVASLTVDWESERLAWQECQRRRQLAEERADRLHQALERLLNAQVDEINTGDDSDISESIVDAWAALRGSGSDYKPQSTERLTPSHRPIFGSGSTDGE